MKQSAYTAYYQTERVAFFFDRREPEELALNRDISLLTAKIYSRATGSCTRPRGSTPRWIRAILCHAFTYNTANFRWTIEFSWIPASVVSSTGNKARDRFRSLLLIL